MIFLAASVGIGFPLLNGWMLVRLLEGKTPLLSPLERIALGFLFGATGMMFVCFAGEWVGLIAFTKAGFLLSHVIILTALLIGTKVSHSSLSALSFAKGFVARSSMETNNQKLITNNWMKFSIAVLTLWTLTKILSMSLILLGTPPYFDDVYNNWNFRGKVFYETGQLTLALPSVNDGVDIAGGVSSYPPTVPLFKTWLATLNGEWHEGLINLPHHLWYLCSLALVYCFLRRRTGVGWSLLGVYGLSSLPLYTFHASAAYADVFLAAHILAALSLLTIPKAHRVAGLALGLLVFTKNEALAIHLPALVLAIVLVSLLKKTFGSGPSASSGGSGSDSLPEPGPGPVVSRKLVQSCCVSLMFIGAPWLFFKFIHSLSFGNAKAVSGLAISFDPTVLKAFFINTFLEGNWNVLPILFIMLSLWYALSFLHKTDPGPGPGPTPLLFLYIATVIVAQITIYSFTSLATEAVNQTGIARGFIQIVPIIVIITCLQLQRILKKSI